MPINTTDAFDPLHYHASKKELREALRQEAKAAHDHYIQTGLHLTAEEVNAWMDEVIAGKRVVLPECHT